MRERFDRERRSRAIRSSCRRRRAPASSASSLERRRPGGGRLRREPARGTRDRERPVARRPRTRFSPSRSARSESVSRPSSACSTRCSRPASSGATVVLGVGGGVAERSLRIRVRASTCAGSDYAHVATSLVAMVDAAIGGKTGVNLRGRQESRRARFRDPVGGVLRRQRRCGRCRRAALREGLAEIVKAAVIEGGEFFEVLEELSAHPLARWPWGELVAAGGQSQDRDRRRRPARKRACARRSISVIRSRTGSSGRRAIASRTARRSRWDCAPRDCSRCEPADSIAPRICAC